MPCPRCAAEIAVRKNRRGDIFYGCTRYPKCDFTTNQKLVAETCPSCQSPYLLELSDKEGVHLVCPNNEERLPKRRGKKSPGDDNLSRPVCHFEKTIGPPRAKEEPISLERPDPAVTRPLAEAVA